MIGEVLAGYTADAPALIPRYTGLDPALVYAAVAEYFPSRPARVLDVGAGPGRDACWLAAQGHKVTAVEPVAAFRAAGQTLAAGQALTAGQMLAEGIRWIDDRLPDLPILTARAEKFEFILLSGVWQHLPPPDQTAALPVLCNLLAAEGVILLSVRHGPGAPGRPVSTIDVPGLIAQGAGLGLEVRHRVEQGSFQPENQALGVTWTWLVFATAAVPPS